MNTRLANVLLVLACAVLVLVVFQSKLPAGGWSAFTHTDHVSCQ